MRREAWGMERKNSGQWPVNAKQGDRATGEKRPANFRHYSLNTTRKLGLRRCISAVGVVPLTNPKRERGRRRRAASDLRHPSLTLRVSVARPFRSGGDQRGLSNFRSAEWDVSEEKTGRWSWWRVARNSGEWLGIVASGEWRTVVGRTAGSGVATVSGFAGV